ncbi:response regulator with CheY-like receiver, AAA-type ATPase, and DNA-binding domains [Desulfitobacterium dichloroeliminans LMG P-21439]|uniref:Stage 0 sporulation protein A homolog n=1 Tax=Desulfitobacterium dichloroeliminans (strain LMG P-21439 / DCA1) TaxID=871963 RepID=L0F5E6_DESDL|nr:sigma-54 dependent transcriptional regulator [Desulfitobacterium dichloroeliminans]AGA67886.1 response regulator with CheY-like receiver, AAA-type ATPase, and DNA-binding domains [Desulfitobacterium dichloroeliminans LMG P-21439]
MKRIPKVLIIDDQDALREIIAKRLKRNGYEVIQTGTAAEGLAYIKDILFDTILLDIKLPDGDGLKLLPQIKELQPDLQVVMLTGHGTIESAIDAMKLGAYDYLTKPCNLSELELTLQKALEKRELLLENTGLRQVVRRQASGFTLIAKSPKMLEVLELTRKVAQTDASILIQGESGVGKDLVAQAIHAWSARSNRPYIPLNAGAIPEPLMESELFGHEKGAFTGAGAQKIGLVEMADQGTLFLDEIGDMPLSLQVKLLRFLESGEFRRVGDTRLRRVNIRVIAATNRNLHEEIKEERFRQDFYYRLNGVTLGVPSLRERSEDILPLAEYFLEKANKEELSTKPSVLAPETKKSLLAYDYPGNVRELSHLIKRGQILASDGVINPSDIWPEKVEVNLKPSKALDPINELNSIAQSDNLLKLEEVERLYILATLEKLNGNKPLAANLLGISLRNLYRKLQSYDKD